MAITGAIFNSLIYGNIDSADYGIYITGEAVYNAPARAVELVSVPGRNGAVAIDQGHWENIEIEYPAGVFGDDQTDFASAISDFRNAIISQLGYQRLSDTYHPDEYRMALYLAGLEVKPDRKANGTAGEFSIIFNAKPQRYLTSGEDAVTVTSGDDLTNPTQYEASPLLAAEGYGNINFNGYDIDIENAVMGEVVLTGTTAIRYNNSLFENGDSITLGSSTITLNITIMAATGAQVTNVTVAHRSGTTSDFHISGYTVSALPESTRVKVTMTTPALEFTAGTTENKYDYLTATITWVNSQGTTATKTCNFDVQVRNVKNTNESQLSVTLQNISSASNPLQYTSGGSDVGDAVLDSTKSILGHPTYIDCDIGEAYLIDNDEVVGLNAYIDLGSDLPTLASGANEVTYDNTITSLEVTPRWWKL